MNPNIIVRAKMGWLNKKTNGKKPKTKACKANLCVKVSSATIKDIDTNEMQFGGKNVAIQTIRE